MAVPVVTGDGWIENTGKSKTPPKRAGGKAYMRIRCGAETKEPENVNGWRWNFENSPGDITHYKPT